ncbi:ELKS/Rab6-interacting/CAST family member 1 isoform X2 [Solanum pennellii]|uniref:ELKS/Rab6-interacting/CAST family member 1 isoform X2 n=1 Tax=Solanum pennellii TaxID=28526 RepID=A0ABM1FP42_SOLPN|nr:ELKS/Rab6-interacting/CAST family member 1 isoform X2 [Solanum pennellii]XP_015059636.1 ELKS/Rab6-interacting/CAST family member 1 isoform X2 [Solanum pennellii]
MSTSSGEHSFDVKELLEIRARCKELRKEKDTLRGSQGQSVELIRKIEQHVQTLSEAREEDKYHTQKLKSELENCSQEIDYLQDQLNLRNEEMDSLSKCVCSLQLKLANLENMEEEVIRLREELEMSNAERLYLLQQLENRELEIEGSALCIERLEESVASIGLEHQFEIESMKLDLITMEQNYFKAKKSQDETAQDNAMMNGLIHDLQLQIYDAEKVIESLEKENVNLREQLQTSEMNARTFSEKVEELFRGLIPNNDDSSSSKEDASASSCCGDILGPLLIKLASLGPSDVDLTEKRKKMAGQIKNNESLVKQLKEELIMEKLKAKEESEDLAQEMAELRYQMTGLLEEERKRRACVEQLSLQRIAELEAQVEKERMKSFTEEDQSKSITVFRHVSEA